MMHLKQSAPYINAHRGKRVVIHLCAQALAPKALETLAHDISLLYTLGVKIALVFDSEITPNKAIPETQLNQHLADITRHSTQIQARLSMGMANSPMQGAHIKSCTGNFVIAKPKGIIQGVDYGHAGKVRKIRSDFIQQLLDKTCLAILPPLGYSPSGEIFHVDGVELAQETAISIAADKLIFLQEDALKDTSDYLLREWVPAQLSDIETLKPNQHAVASAAFKALIGGITRAHILNFNLESAILLELFSRDGCGTLVALQSYESLRTANVEDVPGILALIQPLENEQVLVKRSREHLESEIEQFSVIERDGSIIGCAALHPFLSEKLAEAACIAVHPNYQETQRGAQLLKQIEQRAKTLGIEQIFVLTTHAIHWFIEQGYETKTLEDLPLERQELYNYQRNSKILVKSLVNG